MKRWLFLTTLFALSLCWMGKGRAEEDFEYVSERFADVRILRYQVPGFESLDLQKKKLLYFLSQAALAGRDIHWDQQCEKNLFVRRTLETIVTSYAGERSGKEWDAFMEYTKRVWFSGGIHHHYSSDKLIPTFSEEYLRDLICETYGRKQQSKELADEMIDVLFSERYMKRVNKAAGVDCVVESANNFYGEVTQKEVEAFYAAKKQSDRDPLWGLNSKLVKEDGQLVERVWKIDGMYASAIQEIYKWLARAKECAETEEQKLALKLLMEFYVTGDLATFDAYNIAWVKDTESDVDVINGFIEVYGDPKGLRGSWESVVSVKDPIASQRIEAISEQAQWFEDHSPIADEHKKTEVKGISARVINVVMEGGSASPATPIGINLPNSNWIRSEHGSKSVNLGNIVHAYNEAKKSSGVLGEFFLGEEVIARARADGGLSDDLHTDMHEVIGHASGRLNPGVGTPSETLKQYRSTLEEARADLVALYYLMDEKLVEMGVMPSLETGKTAYDRYITNGMMLQLRRIKVGDEIEEDHMRNRQLIAQWAIELGAEANVIERKVVDGKTYFVVNDYEALRQIFGQQLKEIQRLKSEGDFAAGEHLVETYGVKVDPALHQEVLDRFASLDLAPYSGFINPHLKPVFGPYGQIVDVEISYPTDFTEQMLHYGRHHSFLPTVN